jgi:hypothetical protein
MKNRVLVLVCVASVCGSFACTTTTDGTGTSGASGTGSGGGSGSSGGGGGSGGGGSGNTFTVGPDLTANAPTNPLRCADGYPIQINPEFPQPLHEQGAQSCLILTFLPPASRTITGSGTAVSATIRVGATTGPMRFVRMRILQAASPARPQCCSLEQYGDVFTPTANDVTTVQLGFPMTFDPGPDDEEEVQANDLIALEVLAPDVPLPGFWPRNGAMDSTIANYLWLPAPSEQGVAAPSNRLLNYSAGYGGFVPTFTWTFDGPTR